MRDFKRDRASFKKRQRLHKLTSVAWLRALKSEYCFMESWENLESQKEHMKSAHMVKNAAALEACKESQEVKIINFVSVKE